jgi:hypothetical protein
VQHKQEVTLSVVESDQPTLVTMFNGIGCEIGNWTFENWITEIARGGIIIQVGDKFVMSA